MPELCIAERGLGVGFSSISAKRHFSGKAKIMTLIQTEKKRKSKILLTLSIREAGRCYNLFKRESEKDTLTLSCTVPPRQ